MRARKYRWRLVAFVLSFPCSISLRVPGVFPWAKCITLLSLSRFIRTPGIQWPAGIRGMTATRDIPSPCSATNSGGPSL